MFSGALFAFATSFDEVVVALLLTGPGQRTLPRQMFAGINDNISLTITAAGTLLILLACLLLLTAEALRRRSERLRGRSCLRTGSASGRRCGRAPFPALHRLVRHGPGFGVIMKDASRPVPLSRPSLASVDAQTHKDGRKPYPPQRRSFMKRTLSYLLAAVLGTVASVAFAQETLKIGAPQPMTGPDAPFGDKFKKAYSWRSMRSTPRAA